jgi:hypothetical protein
VKRAAAVLSLVAAAVLVAFAVDVLRWDRSLEAQDVRFLAAPRATQFSEPKTTLPFGVAQTALGGGDDLTFRRQLAGFVRVRPGAALTLTEQLQAIRAETQLELARLSRFDPNPARRSRASNMVGVLALDPSLAPRDPGELANLVRGAIASFRSAVEIDPSNADAKLNLELALRIPGSANLPGPDPSGTRNTGDRAGLRSPGSGY